MLGINDGIHTSRESSSGLGGSRGIGRAIALGLASHGAAVVIGYVKNEAKALEVVKAITGAKGNGAAVQADLSRPDEVLRLFEEAEKAVGALDIVVANAADIMVKPLAECTEEDYDQIFDANTKSVFFTLKEAARRLKNGGRIIVSSTGGTKMFSPGSLFILAARALSSSSCAPSLGNSETRTSQSMPFPQGPPKLT